MLEHTHTSSLLFAQPGILAKVMASYSLTLEEPYPSFGEYALAPVFRSGQTNTIWVETKQDNLTVCVGPAIY